MDRNHLSETHWETVLSASITTAKKLSSLLPVKTADIQRVIESYPMRINPYYMNLIKDPGGAIAKQVIPDIAEIEYPGGTDDPLDEEIQSPVPHLIHRYPDRVILLVSNQCAVYCRFCLRKRRVGKCEPVISDDTMDTQINYIRRHEKIREVILSGGDPLLLSDRRLYAVLSRIRKIPSVKIIRIHTRTPCVLPQRITKDLSDLLKQFHPLFINTHFNHPDEITPEAEMACRMLADRGIPLGCQTVLLKGINDEPEIMKQLMGRLLEIRVKPYYIHQLDQVRGTCHFSVPIDRGIDIMRSLRGPTSGMGVPQFMVDLPRGGGKVPILPDYIEKKGKEKWIIHSYNGEVFEYPLLP